MINKSKLIVFSTAVLILTAASAFSQAPRVFVAESGDDGNPCTHEKQCQTITKALTVVDDAGEVVITESGDYDNFVVSRSVTVAAAPGVNAAIVIGANYAVVINAAQLIDTVTLRNLIIKNNTGQLGGRGVNNIMAANLYVDGCFFTGFSYGIIQGANSGILSVRDSTFRKNNIGIMTYTSTLLSPVYGTIDNTKFEQNTTGLYVLAKNTMTVRNSTFSNNSQFGISVTSNTTGTSQAVIDNCQITGSAIGLVMSNSGGKGSTVFANVTRSTITQNTSIGISVAVNTMVYTSQNNFINNNPNDVVGTLTAAPLK